MRRIRATIAVAMFATAIMLTACSDADAEPAAQGRVVFSTGSSTGVYYAWGSALADRLSERGVALSVTVSSGSRDNIARVLSGEATMALAAQDATVGVDGLVALARVYDDYLHVIVRAQSPVSGLDELDGERVAVGSSGSGTALIAGRLLRDAGVGATQVPLDLDAGLAALGEHSVEAVFWSGGIPTSAVTRFAAATPIRLLPLSGLAGRMQAKYGGVYRPATVPAGSYRSADPVAGMAIANLLVVRPGVSDGTVTAVLDAMFDDRAQLAARVPAARALDISTAIFTGGVPLHTAATEYYRGVKR